MDTIRFQNLIPEVYTDESRDFQILCRLYDSIFNGIKYDTDSIKYIVDSKNIQSSLLPLLQTKLGFLTKKSLNDTEIRYVLRVFPELIRNKGSLNAIRKLLNMCLKLNNIAGEYTISYSDTDTIINGININSHTIIVGINSIINNTELINEIARYILPAGFSFYIYFYKNYNSMADIYLEDKVKLLYSSSNLSSQVRGSNSITDSYQTLSGSTVTYNATKVSNIPKLITDIKYSQDLNGYSNPWAGGDNVNVCGLPNRQIVSGINISVDNDGYTVLNGTSTAAVKISYPVSPIPLDAGEKFVLKHFNPVANSQISYDLKLTYTSGGSSVVSTIRGYLDTINDAGLLSEDNHDCSLTSFTINIPQGITLSNFKLRPMIAKGTDTSIAYSPYENVCPLVGIDNTNVVVSPNTSASSGTTYNVTWRSKAGKIYGGTLDVISGTLTVDTQYLQFTGTETWTSAYSPYLYRYSVPNSRVLSTSASSRACSHFKSASVTSGGGYGYYAYNTSNSTTAWIQFRPNVTMGINNLSDWKNWLYSQYSNGTPVECCYKIKDTTTYKVTPTEIQFLLGTNKIWSDTGNVYVDCPVMSTRDIEPLEPLSYDILGGVDTAWIDSIDSVDDDSFIGFYESDFPTGTEGQFLSSIEHGEEEDFPVVYYYTNSNWNKLNFRGYCSLSNSNPQVSNPVAFDVVCSLRETQYMVYKSSSWVKCNYLGLFRSTAEVASPMTNDLISLTSSVTSYMMYVGGSWVNVNYKATYLNDTQVDTSYEVDNNLIILTGSKYFMYLNNSWRTITDSIYMIKKYVSENNIIGE